MAKTTKKTQTKENVDKKEEKDRKVNTVSSGELSSSSSSSSSAGADVQESQAAGGVQEIQPTAEPERDKTEQEFKYIFPSKGRICPRCGAADTEAYATKDNIQYRKCNRAICRNRYSVRGEKMPK